jgi:transcriptional regulator with XRE-family HTH domain
MVRRVPFPVADYLQRFGEVVRELRTQERLSQEELAFRCSIDRTYISTIERGKKSTTIKTLLRLGDALNTTPARLLVATEKKLRR